MSLFKSTLLYTIGNLFVRSLSFLLLPFYSNLISVKEFGNYALIMSGYAILAAVYQGGLQNGYSKFYFENTEGSYRRNIFSTMFNSVLLVGLCISILFTILAKDLSQLILNDAGRSYLIKLAVWTLLLDSLFFTALHLLKTQEQAKKVIYYASFSAIFNLIFNIFFVYILRHGINGILEAQLISGIFSLFIIFPVLKKNIIFKIENVLLKKMIIFSLPLLISGILSSFVDVADRFIINDLMDKNAVGLYSFAYRIALIMNVFVISFRTAWTPYSLRMYKEKEKYPTIFGANFTKLIAVSLLVFLIITLFIDDLFSVKIYSISILNPNYERGINIIPLVMLGYIFSGLVSYYSVYPFVSGKSYHFIISDSIAFVTNIVFNLLLIPVWGLVGAGIATMFSFAFSFIYLMIISKEIKTEYQKLELISIIVLGILFFLIGSYFDLIFIDITLLLSFSYLINSILKLNRFSLKSVMK
jgi:O-antigen/teichoic acid export membrane protein